MKIINADSLAGGRFEGATDGPASISMFLEETEPGDIVLAPPAVAHTFTNQGRDGRG